MIELKKLAKSINKTIKDSDLHNVTIGFSEVLLDNLIDDGTYREIPVISSIIGTGKVVLGIREKLFLKKLIYFLSELKDIPKDKRREMIDKIDFSQKYKIKIGEKLLYIIEKCDDHEKAKIIAYLFSAFVEGTLTYDEFLRAVNITEKLLTEDLIEFVKGDFEEGFLIDSQEYLSSGLVYLQVWEQKDWKDPDYHNQLEAIISSIGEKIKEVLKNKLSN
jgi:hypothetical protein